MDVYKPIFKYAWLEIEIYRFPVVLALGGQGVYW